MLQNHSDVQPQQISASVTESQNSQRAVCNEWLVEVQGEKDCETLMSLGRTFDNYRTSRVGPRSDLITTVIICRTY